MSYLNKSAILGATDCADLQHVEVPAWGGTVCIRPISAATRDRFEAALLDPKRRHLARATMVAGALCDADGTLLFSAADIPALAERSAEAIDLVFDAILAHSRLDPEAMEDASGNSAATS